uniref:Uncharacterized protein n=1 Tax=Panagrolaimus superbus TaxID=310955 RepID=A0A914YHZ8_9BILA
MFTRPGRVAVDGVYCSGTGTDGAVVPACDVTETLRALAFRGVQLTYEHTMLQLYPSPFATCDFMVRFPEWLPLDKWVPQVSGNAAVAARYFYRLPDCRSAGGDFPAV